MGIHDGHRSRMKERFASHGLDGFNDHNALEMLLFYALPRKDTNEIAHKLLLRFGSLSKALEAEYTELCEVDGIGENAAVLLKLIPEVSRRYMVDKNTPRVSLKESADVRKYFESMFMYETDELGYALFLDNDNKIITCKNIGKGVVNATEVSVRKLVELAMQYKAASVIIAHNHPKGLPLPSREDEYANTAVKKALNLVGVELIDHFIVGENSCLSMKQHGLM